MATVPPPPSRDKDLSGTIWQQWFRKLWSTAATVVESPTVDNFASLDANGNVQDSGYDATSFVGTAEGLTHVKTDGSRDITMTTETEWRVGDGTNYAQIAKNGTRTFVGNSRFWKQRILKPYAVSLPAANPPALDNIDGFPFDRFDRSTEEQVYYVWEVPNDFATGDASVKAHFDFIVENPPALVDENVRMGIEYKKLSDMDVFSFAAGTSSGTVDETLTAGETPYIIHNTSQIVCVTTGWVSGDKILFRPYRDATAPEDTYDNEAAAADNDVWVFLYVIDYLANKHGEAV